MNPRLLLTASAGFIASVLVPFAALARPLDDTSSSSKSLSAIEDFKPVVSDRFVPSYQDKRQSALAINAAKYQDKFASATATYKGANGTFDLVLVSLAETDGESVYRVFVNEKSLGKVTNPPTENDYQPIGHRFESTQLSEGDVIRVDFNSASNGKIPEGDAFAFARGRWRSIQILAPGEPFPSAATPLKTITVATEPVVLNVMRDESAESDDVQYDPANAKKVTVQKDDGTVVVEAEDFDAVAKQTHRAWYKTTAEQTPDVNPDPDPNHAEGASGGAYLEILPDTRVTHADKLVRGVSFTDKPGECSVLYYPIKFTQPGRYYVWVRMCCTGSEDNGIHIGLDGQWPKSGERMQFTGKHGEWQWDSRQRTKKVHTGVLGQIWLDIEEPGLHTVMFSMREDGFEFDKFMLTPKKAAMKSKNGDLGPMP
ncbi:MAG: hypothetical protein AAFV88_19635 [Planctomycetota bacterium]